MSGSPHNREPQNNSGANNLAPVKLTIVSLLVIMVIGLVFVIIAGLKGSGDEPADPVPVDQPAESTTTADTQPAAEATAAPTTEAPEEEETIVCINYKGHSYCLIDKDVTWDEAEAMCREMGGHLASINSEEEQNFIVNFAVMSFKEKIWIGAYYSPETKKWRWVDETPFKKSFWMDGKADIKEGNSALRCGSSDDKRAGKWEPVNSKQAAEIDMGFICEWPYTTDTKTFDGHTYCLIEASLTWDKAEEYCANLGGHLASINSPDEQKFIQGMADNAIADNIWLGGYYDTTAKEWKWSDSSVFNYSNWDSKKPDNYYGDEYYVKFPCRTQKFKEWTANKGKWDDVRIGADGDKGDVPLSSFGFICEWKEPDFKLTDFGDLAASK